MHPSSSENGNDSVNDIELLTADDVRKLLKCSRSQVYKMRSAGLLPRPIQLFPGVRGARWIRKDIVDFILKARSLTDAPAPRAFVPVKLVDIG